MSRIVAFAFDTVWVSNDQFRSRLYVRAGADLPDRQRWRMLRPATPADRERYLSNRRPQ